MVVPTLFLVLLVTLASAQGQACNFCQMVVTVAENFIQTNATESAILAELDSICANIPIFSAQCTSYVNQYGPEAIAWVLKKQNPATFCTEVGACSSAKKHHKARQTTKIAKRDEEQSTGCTLCQFIILQVESYLAQNQTEQQIVSQLDAVCQSLGPLSSECVSLVASYVPQMIAWIEQKESPSAFCGQIGVCGARPARRLPVVRRERLTKRDENEPVELQQVSCQICQLIVHYVEQYLAQNNTIAQIEAKLDKVCADFGPISGVCTSAVNSYLPQLIAWINNKENPNAFCSSIHVCTGKVVKDKKL
jgi:saposin